VIATAGDEFFNRLNEVAGDVMTPRATVEAAAATYLVYYRHHIATEEREIMPRAAQLLTQRDWAAVEANVPPDPLFGDVVEARFQELRSQIAGDVRVLRREQVSSRKPSTLLRIRFAGSGGSGCLLTIDRTVERPLLGKLTGKAEGLQLAGQRP
jgi:hypothetical protein